MNRCGFAHIAAYFKDGTMPGNDSFCAFDGDQFHIPFLLNGTLEENILQAGLTNLFS